MVRTFLDLVLDFVARSYGLMQQVLLQLEASQCPEVRASLWSLLGQLAMVPEGEGKEDENSGKQRNGVLQGQLFWIFGTEETYCI